ncbi:MAG: GGDEF domain-containing protein [Gammaproteobacteria bacterium]|nr:GGDEF domain-containing protein [Gammaproteobacteria bacterium]
MKNTEAFRVVKEEQSQSIARLIYAIAVGIYIVWLNHAPVNITSTMPELKLGNWLLAFIAIFTLSILLHVRMFPKPMLIRQVIAILGDIGCITVGMYVFGEMGNVFFALYLWVVIGNGLRFGEKHLIFAQTLSLLGFLFVIWMNPFWQNHLPLTIGLLLSLIILPVFFRFMILRLREVHEKLEQQFHAVEYAVSHDALTNLENRRAFLLHLENLLARVKRKGWYGAILYIDLDGFKLINDTHGHKYGDEVLVLVASRISELLREEDIFSRLGGDEFVIALEEIVPESELIEKNMLTIIEKINKSFVEPINVLGEELIVKLSTGVALIDADVKNTDELLDHADKAMYRVKASKK